MDFFTSRRQVLITASVIGLGTAGLTALPGCSSSEPEPIDPDPHLVDTLQHTRLLHAGATNLQDAGVGNAEIWQHLLDDYDAHIEALQRLLGPDDDPDALDEEVPDHIEDYQEILRSATFQATESCLASPSELATLLGEIAACRHGHLELLL